jgi:hypothetical protein
MGLLSFLVASGSVGFAGSRSASAAGAGALALAVSGAGAAVLVPAPSSPSSPAAAVLSAVPGARVFSPPAGLFGGRALAARASAFCRVLAACGGVLVVWPAVACPAGLLPARRWPSGCGSGSWSEAALCFGRGASVVVVLPAGVAPPSAWGVWSRCSVGPAGAGWLLASAARPLL